MSTSASAANAASAAKAASPANGVSVAKGASAANGASVAKGASADPRGAGNCATSHIEPADEDARTEPEAPTPDANGAADTAEPQVVTRSRRFPRLTRDTARPEGGGRAAPGDAPAPARQWPILTVLGIAALGLFVTALDLTRAGILLIGAALLAGAVLRWVLPGVGMVAVRSRFTDIVTYGVLGGAIVLLALMAQPHPWLEIPFLKDTLHFTLH
ncbi:DUF3017 domain-containing protein [Streptomyces sp. YIM S03343]